MYQPSPYDSALESLIDTAYERMLSAIEPLSARAYFEHLMWLMSQRTPERQLHLEVERRRAS